ncbi:hypothetical protein F8C76_01480 [Flagellimonas olearia]|uniref:Uncharacterized protein n=1 Tax=Flagellimonas olearia TaxID=552546 RepID=A0A6I1DZD8_9FLAO|nr:hypothetical protein [Allomuricauda olearia]KAB7530207.1 hypothetical protein F8C76_01480 [Allomuricauda olearia]
MAIETETIGNKVWDAIIDVLTIERINTILEKNREMEGFIGEEVMMGHLEKCMVDKGNAIHCQYKRMNNKYRESR